MFPLPAVARVLRLLIAALLLQAGAAGARGFMWEATRQGPDRAQRVLLLGTVHVGRGDEGALSLSRLKRVLAADVIAVEADVRDAARTLAAFQRFALFSPEAPGLDAQIDPALRARIERLLPRFGLQANVVMRFKPWALANNLVVLEAARLGYSPAGSTEVRLFALAADRGKPVVEIESVEQQLALFDGAPDAVQLAYLEQAVASVESGEGAREIRSLLAAWTAADAAGMRRRLEGIRNSANAGERWVGEHVIDGRHDGMVAAIERYAASARLHVVAVGSLHFFGPGGLLERLRARGWRIVEVP